MHLTALSMQANKHKGFSLLELMIVLVLTAMLAGVVATSLSQGPTLRKNAREVAASLRQTRTLAIMQQKQMVWRMNIETQKFWIDGAKRPPKNVHPQVQAKVLTSANEAQKPGEAGIRFFPDGSSVGGKVELSHKQQIYHINVEWISGRVTLQ